MVHTAMYIGDCTVCFCITWRWVLKVTYFGGEVAACLELLEEGRHEDGGEEEDHTPEEHIRDVRAMGTTGGAFKLTVQQLALLLAPDDTVMAVVMITIRMMSRTRRAIMKPRKMVRVTVGMMMDVSDELVEFK